MQTVNQFNDYMESVFDLLEYATLNRIWIERTEQTVSQRFLTVNQHMFGLLVKQHCRRGCLRIHG